MNNPTPTGMLRFADMESGENVAFFGAHEQSGPFSFIGWAKKSGDSWSADELQNCKYRYIAMWSVEPVNQQKRGAE